MSFGYNLPLYLLPFDHRHSYVSGMFQLHAPLTATQRRAVIRSKQVIYDGFRNALGGELTVDTAGLLVDEEFGGAILCDANRRGYVTALSTERSGSAEFEFEYGSAPSTTQDPVSRRRAYRICSSFSGRRHGGVRRSARVLACRSRVASSRRTAAVSRSRALRAEDPPSRLQCLSRRNTAPDVTTLFDEAPLLRVGYRLESVVSPELAVDVMKVVAERLGGDT